MAERAYNYQYETSPRKLKPEYGQRKTVKKKPIAKQAAVWSLAALHRCLGNKIARRIYRFYLCADVQSGALWCYYTTVSACCTHLFFMLD